jgi:uncharacterized repeat protein (TIGR01451 family)
VDKLDGVFVADFNGDGYADVLSLWELDDKKIAWYQNVDGTGDFGEQQIIYVEAIGESIVSICAADLNGDGFQDVVFTSSDGAKWLKNLDGFGNFSPPQEIVNTSEYFKSACSGDFDADGDEDILTFGISGMKWFENKDGLGGEWAENYIAGGTFRSVKIDDINSDGYLDIISNSVYSDNKIAIFENVNGTGVFEKKLAPDDGDVVSSGDINGDGSIDIVSILQNKIAWLINHSVQIISRCFLDFNENGIYDSLDIGLNNQLVTLEPNSDFFWSDEIGQINYHVSLGDYSLEYYPSQIWMPTTPVSQSVQVTNAGEIIFVDFGVKPSFQNPQAAVTLTSAPTRCGFTVPFWLHYENTGTQIADGIVSLELDPLVTYVSASPAPDSIDGNQYFWHFQDLNPTWSNQINLELEMPDVTFQGEFIEMTSKVILQEGGANIYEGSHTFSSQINCSYDPNDKLVEPNIPGEENYTLSGDTLIYTIRFQNTGTDTAINIRIEDILDNNLNWSTFRVMAASHAYEVYLNGNGRVVFKFDDIYLPDSTTNEIASHGFIKYRIQALGGLPENTSIPNSAKIFFDFNPPVLTNVVSNILVSEYPVFADVQNPLCHDSEDGSIGITVVSPETVFYEWSTSQAESTITGLSGGAYSLTVTNATGQVVADTTITLTAPGAISLVTSATPELEDNADGTATVEAAGGTPPFTYAWNTEPVQTTETATDLPAGTYLVVVTDANGCTAQSEATVEKTVNTTEAALGWKFQVHPNPSSGSVKIDFELNKPQRWVLQVHDSSGKLLRELAAPNGGTAKAGFEIQNLRSGIYKISLQAAGRILSRKLVVVEN